MVLLAAGLTGTTLALPLMVLSPLPIAIAGLGWGSTIGFIAAGITFIGLTLISSVTSGLIFAGVIGAPIAYIVHLTGLSRQDDPNQPEEWFPIGTILLRTVIIGGAVVGLALVISGFDVEATTRHGLTVFEETLKQLDETSRKALEEAIAFQVWFTPYSMPMAWLLVMWLNLSLAIKIVKMSELFKRPTFHLKDAELPFLVLPAFGVAILISLTSPPLAHIGAAFVGIISMVFIILGFNTLHVITARISMRGMLLSSLYLATIFFGVPAVPVLGIGLADLIIKIRQRYRLANPD